MTVFCDRFQAKPERNVFTWGGRGVMSMFCYWVHFASLIVGTDFMFVSEGTGPDDNKMDPDLS